MVNLDRLPQPSDRRIALHITPAAERAMRQGHPWLFNRAIRRQSHDGAPGDLAVIFDARRRFLAIGLYDPQSPIRVRILQHHQPATIDQEWFAARLRAAVARRDPLRSQPTTGYRLVHGENDGLPGLVLDRYAETLVLKLDTAAWLPHLQDVLASIPAVQPHERLVLRLSRHMQAGAAADLTDGQMLVGEHPGGPVEFEENGLRFAADVLHGHKTGFFFDQRDNRARVRARATGRRVLDLFAYSGGFAVYALMGGATAVTSVDVSAPALEAATANVALNRAAARRAHFQPIVADVFDFLAQAADEHRRYDMVIVDPPAFAKREAEVERALRAYARLTRLALNVLAPDGVLVMSSCSSRVSPGAFFETVYRAAAQAGRRLNNIEQTGHTLDHPIGFPEGEYLKCLFATAAN